MVSDVVGSSGGHDVVVQYVAVYDGCLHQPKKQLSPPLHGLSEETVVDSVLVGYVYAVHVLIVHVYHRWLRLWL